MKKLTKLFSWIVLSLMLCSLLIGYAAVADTLIVSGTVSYQEKPYEGIYISEVEIHTQTDVDTVDFEIVKPTTLKSTVVTSGNNPTVTFKITVHNNTDITYWYHGVKAHDDYGANSNVNQIDGINISTKDSSASNSAAFNTEDWVPLQTTRTFYATYQFGKNARGEVATMVNFSFGLHLDAVHDDFASLLNTPSSYAYITQLFNDAYNEDGTKVLGNVGDDEQAINALFGGQPKIDVNGVETPVTIMIHRENINKKPNTNEYSGGDPSSCEYTVYFTVEDTSSPGGSVTVYATTYTLGSDGVWFQLGELYEGTATKMDYNGNAGNYEGTFDISQWEAVQKRYYIGDKLNYGTGYVHEQFNKQTSFADIINVDDTNFCNNINNELKTTLLMPACNTVYSYKHNNQSGGYDEFIDTDNYGKPGYDQLKVAYDRIAQHCYSNSNGGQDVRIRNDTGLSRAELVYLIKQLKTAYDYYCQVNPNG